VGRRAVAKLAEPPQQLEFPGDVVIASDPASTARRHRSNTSSSGYGTLPRCPGSGNLPDRLGAPLGRHGCTLCQQSTYGKRTRSSPTTTTKGCGLKAFCMFCGPNQNDEVFEADSPGLRGSGL
jgi:hypothetical protein